MQNIKTTVKGNTLVIEIDITKRLGRSKSGKTTIVASTGGNVPVPGADGVVLGLNAYTKE